MGNSSRRAVLHRLFATLLCATAVAGSLVVFPNAIVWMAAFWLAIASFQFARGRSAWFPLAICLIVLVIKQPEWSLALITFSLTLLVAAAYLFFRRKVTTKLPGYRSYRVLVILWALWIIWCWNVFSGVHQSQQLALMPDRPIVCLGDSLTTGLGEGEAYPEYLRDLVSVPVINWGRPGVTARDMTKHLPEILDDRPQLVVVELGGHDFLRGYGRASARESLVTIIEACQAAGAAVMLVEIPRAFITDPFAGLERELARDYDLELLPDSAIRMLVVRSPAIPFVGDLARPHLSGDGLHPSKLGAAYLASQVSDRLHRVYGPAITSSALRTPLPGSQ